MIFYKFKVARTVDDIIEDPTNDEGENYSTPLEPVTRDLNAAITIHNFLLHLKNSTTFEHN